MDFVKKATVQVNKNGSTIAMAPIAHSDAGSFCNQIKYFLNIKVLMIFYLYIFRPVSMLIVQRYLQRNSCSQCRGIVYFSPYFVNVIFQVIISPELETRNINWQLARSSARCLVPLVPGQILVICLIFLFLQRYCH